MSDMDNGAASQRNGAGGGVYPVSVDLKFAMQMQLAANVVTRMLQ